MVLPQASARTPHGDTHGAHEVLWVPCDGEWLLALHHYVPRLTVGKHPVLMVHGIAANRYHFDLDMRHSLARYSAARGFDTYVLELRGAGLSQSVAAKSAQRRSYGFGDYAEGDVPAAIAFVQAHTGAKFVHGVGHSMGGMLLFCAGTVAGIALRSITTIGTPLIGTLQLHLGPRERRLLQVATHLSPAARLTPPGQRRVPLKRLLTAAGWMMPLSSRLADNLLLNGANIEPAVLARVVRYGIQDIPLQLLLEITEQMHQSRADSGPYAYEAQLGRVRAPVLAISGSVDRIAPPATVSAAVARMAGPDLRYREMGPRFGDRIDYGHVDLLLGKHAPTEIYPQVMDFIEDVEAHASAGHVASAAQ